ncbi:MAG TPA: HD domain-containing protein [Candidatus Thermoplasmatota archaeon]|nr:HD domain-containing protein [Candidatus Thermoplasmatota archaeon]
MITRDEAYALLLKNLRTKNLVKHSLAVEAILSAMAEKLGEDPELWAVTGLLHDLDYEYTKEEPEKHAFITVKLVNELLPSEAINAIRAHNYAYTQQIPLTYLDKSLIAADAVSGLIVAAALVMPSKKLADVTPRTLLDKFKDKSFAAGCNRKRIELCADMELSLQAFLELSLQALKNISGELGL